MPPTGRLYIWAAFDPKKPDPVFPLAQIGAWVYRAVSSDREQPEFPDGCHSIQCIGYQDPPRDGRIEVTLTKTWHEVVAVNLKPGLPRTLSIRSDSSVPSARIEFKAAE